MQSVNVHLKLTGEQQLSLLEELLALLHHDREEEATKDDAKEDHSRALRLQFSTSRPAAPVAQTNNGLEPAAGDTVVPLVPLPPTSAPPDNARRRVQRAGRTIHGRTKRRSRPVDIDVDPHLYLNEAEITLLSLSSRASIRPAHSDPDVSQQLSPQSHFQRRFAADSRSCSASGQTRMGQDKRKSGFWLQSSVSTLTQSWLRQKNEEFFLKRRNEQRERREKRRMTRERSLRESERREEARSAYDSWLQQKRAEEKAKKTKTAVEDKRYSSQFQSHHPTPTAAPPTGAQSMRARPLRKPAQQHGQPESYPLSVAAPTAAATTIIKRQISFDEWARQKARKSRHSVQRDTSNDLPEDLQAIVKGVRKLRLQQKESSKKHVDTGRQARKLDARVVL